MENLTPRETFHSPPQKEFIDGWVFRVAYPVSGLDGGGLAVGPEVLEGEYRLLGRPAREPGAGGGVRYSPLDAYISVGTGGREKRT